MRLSWKSIHAIRNEISQITENSTLIYQLRSIYPKRETKYCTKIRKRRLRVITLRHLFIEIPHIVAIFRHLSVPKKKNNKKIEPHYDNVQYKDNYILYIGRSVHVQHTYGTHYTTAQNIATYCVLCVLCTTHTEHHIHH